MPTGYGILAGVCVACLLLYGIFSQFKPKSWEEEEFRHFIRAFNKSYANETEYQHRLQAFKQSLINIETMNQQREHKTSALYGVTPFSDMRADEFFEMRLRRMAPRRAPRAGGGAKKRQRFSVDVPRALDWRALGAVTAVNDQRACGACWAFGAIETLEAAHWLRTGELLALSAQQMIDCARDGNRGCGGGDVCALLRWLTDNDVAVRRAADYPLRLRDEPCRVEVARDPRAVRVARFACADFAGLEDDLLATVALAGPVAAAANALSWQNYLGGVIQHHCASHPALMNHAVQIVGYDLDAEIPHYLVRNSWGLEFGHDGYLQIAVGDNLCGIANEVAIVEAT